MHSRLIKIYNGIKIISTEVENTIPDVFLIDEIIEFSDFVFVYKTLTINFFFCLNRSLHKKTTAVLKTKHIACSSRPFLIFPKKSEIFNHSTPP